MTIKKAQDKAFANSLKHGFHHKGQNIGEQLMLIVSELSEALEAYRVGRRFDRKNIEALTSDDPAVFKACIKDTFEDELADATIRILDLAGYLGINLEAHILAKMKYNESRPHKHGKNY